MLSARWWRTVKLLRSSVRSRWTWRRRTSGMKMRRHAVWMMLMWRWWWQLLLLRMHLHRWHILLLLLLLNLHIGRHLAHRWRLHHLLLRLIRISRRRWLLRSTRRIHERTGRPRLLLLLLNKLLLTGRWLLHVEQLLLRSRWLSTASMQR